MVFLKVARISVSGLFVRCIVVIFYSLSRFCYGKLRVCLVRERVLLELSRDEGVKNCCGSFSLFGFIICVFGLVIFNRFWIIFRIDRGF